MAEYVAQIKEIIEKQLEQEQQNKYSNPYRFGRMLNSFLNCKLAELKDDRVIYSQTFAAMNIDTQIPEQAADIVLAIREKSDFDALNQLQIYANELTLAK